MSVEQTMRAKINDPVLIDRAYDQVDTATRLRRLQALARMLDTAFEIPGIPIRFGVDSLVGLIPVAGDVATTAISAYIVREAHQLGVPKHKLARMLFNMGLDLCIGAVPLVGDLFDIAWKSNKRNVAILIKDIEQRRRHV